MIGSGGSAPDACSRYIRFLSSLSSETLASCSMNLIMMEKSASIPFARAAVYIWRATAVAGMGTETSSASFRIRRKSLNIQDRFALLIGLVLAADKDHQAALFHLGHASRNGSVDHRHALYSGILEEMT